MAANVIKANISFSITSEVIQIHKSFSIKIIKTNIFPELTLKVTFKFKNKIVYEYFA